MPVWYEAGWKVLLVKHYHRHWKHDSEMARKFQRQTLPNINHLHGNIVNKGFLRSWKVDYWAG